MHGVARPISQPLLQNKGLQTQLLLPRGIYSHAPDLQVEVVLKNPPANAGDIRDEGLIPGLGDPLEEGMVKHASILYLMDRGT